MRFIPAVSGVQIPPLLPEHDRKPGNIPGFFCYGLHLSCVFPCRITARLWANWPAVEGKPRKGCLCCGTSFMRRSAPDGSRSFRDVRRRQRAPAGARRFCAPCTGCALLGGFSSLPGENAENTCQRGASSVDASLRCGKSTDALWQGSSVGQSMRFIPAVSGVQIPPLLPEDSSGSGLSRAAFLL